jgi:hypothetical protein
VAILGTLGLWIALIIGIRELQHQLMERKNIMAKSTRRQWLKGGLALGGLTLFGASYSEMVQRRCLPGCATAAAVN